jgi:hypothetical protein
MPKESVKRSIPFKMYRILDTMIAVDDFYGPQPGDGHDTLQPPIDHPIRNTTHTGV